MTSEKPRSEKAQSLDSHIRNQMAPFGRICFPNESYSEVLPSSEIKEPSRRIARDQFSGDVHKKSWDE